MNDLTKKILFVGGKGGVGKSTTAAAIAWNAAKAGRKTLLVSTDPAHNIGDIFDQKIGGNIKHVNLQLYAIEIDPDLETTTYIDGVKENIKNFVHTGMVEEVNRQLDTAKASPGADEAALFDKLISIIIHENVHFDQLVIDTAPTGHTVRLLTLPELMGVWMEGLIKRRQKTNQDYSQLLNDGNPVEDPIFDVLKERQDRFAKARALLLDQSITGYIFVLNPERLSIAETEKAIQLLEKYHLYVQTLIINKVLPEQIDGEFLLQRSIYEEKYVDLIHHTFSKQQKIFIPLYPHDIIDMKQLEKFGAFHSM
ncbi:ArsA family ATPase [Virgibacillus salexigens]|uniref:ArsA family ATPase n=1 Tax=Virgibacillus salexigens TaxID=61016 RepID=UPI00190E1113|nr:TRC40/GET3/ArsA family transport-energizing ATPase [Virgibacillus salexigens]